MNRSRLRHSSLGYDGREGFLLIALALAAGCGPDMPLSRPQWSPRGDRAAFVRYTPRGHALYIIIDPAKADAPRLVEKNVQRFSFSTTGTKLYYLRPGQEDERGGALVALHVYATDVERDAPKALARLAKGAEFKNLQVAAGGKIYLEKQAGEKGRSLLEFDAKTRKSRDVTPGGAGWCLPAIDPGSKPVALLMKAGADSAIVALATTAGKEGVELSRMLLPDGKPAAIGRLEAGYSAPAVMAVSPSADRLLLFAEKGEVYRLVVLGPVGVKARAFALPGKAKEGEERIPVAACFGPGGKTVYFTLLVDKNDSGPGASDEVESYSLDPATGKVKKLAAARGRLVGARATSARGGRRLEFTPGGLALFAPGVKEPVRIWSVGVAETAAAARVFLAAKRPDRALEAVAAALDRAGPRDDRAALYVLKSEVLAAAGKSKDAANAYLESLLRYPVTDLTRTDRQIARRLAAWSDEYPDQRILDLVAQAYRRRAAGDPAGAARIFKKASGFAGDRAWAAGLLFGCALNLLEAGHGAKAGLVFRQVSEVKEFPQADWAAGLGVIAYAVGRRDDLAGENIQRCQDRYKKSFLFSDFKALAEALKIKTRAARNLGEVRGPGGPGGAGARLEARPTAGAHVCFTPRATPAGAERRLALASYDLYRIVLVPGNGPQRALLDRVPFEISELGFSPQGDRLAFLAGPEGETSLYAVDLSGKALMGDLKKLLAGRLDPRTRAAGYRWPKLGGLPRAIGDKPGR